MANNLAPAERGNALQITQRYPAENYNLLVPMQTVAEIADIHKPVIRKSTNRRKPRVPGRTGTATGTRPPLQATPLPRRASTSSCGRRA